MIKKERKVQISFLQENIRRTRRGEKINIYYNLDGLEQGIDVEAEDVASVQNSLHRPPRPRQELVGRPQQGIHIPPNASVAWPHCPSWPCLVARRKGGNKGYQVAPMAFFWRLSQTRLVRHSRIRAFMAFSDWPGLGIQIEVTNDHENAVAFSTNLLLHL